MVITDMYEIVIMDMYVKTSIFKRKYKKNCDAQNVVTYNIFLNIT